MADFALCWSCAGRIEAADRFCRHCGHGQGEHIPWYYEHWGILVSTFLGLGPFSLVLVWRSPRLSPSARWGYTAGIGVLTFYMAAQLYKAWLLVQSATTGLMQGMGL